MLKTLFSSKKFITLVVGVVVTVAVRLGAPEDSARELALLAAGLFATYLGAQGAADHGKEAEKVAAESAREEKKE